MRNLIIEKLKAKGYEVEPCDVEKNGIVKKGIRLAATSGVTVTPVIYMEDFNTVREIIAYAEQSFSAPTPSFIPDQLSDWDYVKDHIAVCVQKKSREPIEKEDFLDFECYLRVFINEETSYKVTSSIMTLISAKAGSNDEVWERAYLNTREKSVCKIKREDFLFSIHNNLCGFGGNAILFTDKLIKMAELMKTDLIVFPLSIDCLYLMPNIVEDISDMHYLVKDLITVIPPEERLTESIYIARIGSETLEKIS